MPSRLSSLQFPSSPPTSSQSLTGRSWQRRNVVSRSQPQHHGAGHGRAGYTLAHGVGLLGWLCASQGFTGEDEQLCVTATACDRPPLTTRNQVLLPSEQQMMQR